ncbi:MAG: hypothetical protein ACQESP_09675 [Candidatus Muiribacteriota bacterium]
MKRKLNKILLITLISSLIFLITGCNDGSYLSPIGMSPYSSGETGSLRGIVIVQSRPHYFFGEMEEQDEETDEGEDEEGNGEDEEDEDGEEDEDLIGDLLEQMNQAPQKSAIMRNTEYDRRDTYLTLPYSIIRIAGKKYIFDPSVEASFYISDIPTGYHTITIEAPGYKKKEKDIKIYNKENILIMELKHPEIINPNYYHSVSNIDFYTETREIAIYEDIADSIEFEGEESFEDSYGKTLTSGDLESVFISNNQMARFSNGEINIFIDDEMLIEKNLLEYSDDFVEALGIWENACSFFDFKLVDNIDDAHFSVEWVEDFGETVKIANTFRINPDFPEFSYKPLIRLGIYLPGTDRKPVERFRKLIMLKEIAHALGLWGTSSNPNDVLYDGDSNIIIEGEIGLSDADINTMKMLYDTTPNVTEKSFNIYRGGGEDI